YGVGCNEVEALRPYHISVKLGQSKKDIHVYFAMRAEKKYHEVYKSMAGPNQAGIADVTSRTLYKTIEEQKKKEPDCFIIVSWHMQGADYSLPKPKGRVQRINEKIVAAGADCIVMHGTHTIGPVRLIDGKPIFNSIGNFVFNSPGGYTKKEALPYSAVFSLLVRLNKGVMEFVPYMTPIFSDNKESGFKSRTVSEDECNLIKETLEASGEGENSLSLYVGKVKGEWALAISEDAFIIEQKFSRVVGADAFPLASLNKGEMNDYSQHSSFSTNAEIGKELSKRGFSIENNGRYLLASLEKKVCAIFETETSLTSALGARIAKDKEKAKHYLQRAGVNVSKGKVFDKEEKDSAFEWLSAADKPMVVKPSNGKKGEGVTVGVNINNFSDAWDFSVATGSKKIILEEAFVNGEEARYLVVNGKCVAVSFRIPPFVKGDGKSSIHELIEEQNLIRKKNPNTGRRPIIMDSSRISRLKSLGFEIEDVLPEGKEIFLDSKANISTGASAMDITELVHPEMKRIAEKSATCFPGLDVVGVDILAYNHLLPPTVENYVVVEINTRPGIGGHHYPAYGKSVNVAGYIAKYLSETL
ncbi:unnamed protein product, partial [Ectocarpus sp. 12 AP-2014]